MDVNEISIVISLVALGFISVILVAVECLIRKGWNYLPNFKSTITQNVGAVLKINQSHEDTEKDIERVSPQKNEAKSSKLDCTVNQDDPCKSSDPQKQPPSSLVDPVNHSTSSSTGALTVSIDVHTPDKPSHLDSINVAASPTVSLNRVKTITNKFKKNDQESFWGVQYLGILNPETWRSGPGTDSSRKLRRILLSREDLFRKRQCRSWSRKNAPGKSSSAAIQHDTKDQTPPPIASNQTRPGLKKRTEKNKQDRKSKWMHSIIAGDLEYFTKADEKKLSQPKSIRTSWTDFHQPEKNMKSYLFSKREELKQQPKRRNSLDVNPPPLPPPKIDLPPRLPNPREPQPSAESTYLLMTVKPAVSKPRSASLVAISPDRTSDHQTPSRERKISGPSATSSVPEDLQGDPTYVVMQPASKP